MAAHGFPDDAFPAIVAHRGASATHPENTLTAFRAALELGVPVIELDVRLTSDGAAVVMHDPDVSRTTDGAGLVHELPASRLAELNAGTPRAPEPVPTLADALELISGRAAVALEIKSLPGEPNHSDREALVEAAHAELERCSFAGPVLILSFDPRSIEASKAMAPEVPTGFLSTHPVDPRDALAYAAKEGHDLVLPGTWSLIPAGPDYVDEVHAAGLRVGTWTVDDRPTLEMLLDRGLDAIASNDPRMAMGCLTDRARPA